MSTSSLVEFISTCKNIRMVDYGTVNCSSLTGGWQLKHLAYQVRRVPVVRSPQPPLSQVLSLSQILLAPILHLLPRPERRPQVVSLWVIAISVVNRGMNMTGITDVENAGLSFFFNEPTPFPSTLYATCSDKFVYVHKYPAGAPTAPSNSNSIYIYTYIYI